MKIPCVKVCDAGNDPKRIQKPGSKKRFKTYRILKISNAPQLPQFFYLI